MESQRVWHGWTLSMHTFQRWTNISELVSIDYLSFLISVLYLPQMLPQAPPFPPDICSNVTEHYFSNTPSSLMTPQYFLKNYNCLEQDPSFHPISRFHLSIKNISALLMGRYLSSSSVFKCFLLCSVLCEVDLILAIIIRPLIPTEGAK